MNFLSHFYFDRANPSSLEVAGAVLPDLVRNAVHAANLFPNKCVLTFDINEKNLLKGWNKHLLVDKLFHSSSFFAEQTAILRPLLKPVVGRTQIRPSFLAHISVELMLDHLLIEEKMIDVRAFYDSLSKTDLLAIRSFLEKSHLTQTDSFFTFYDKFLRNEYLFSYTKLESISYALNQICLRLWPLGLNDDEKKELTTVLILYKRQLKTNFLSIFAEISAAVEIAV